MTAIEWLANRLPSIDFEDDPYYRGLFNIAKELEKRQLEKAFVDGAFLFRGDHEDNRFNEWFEQFKNK